MELNTEPYKGTRDFYPKDMYMQKYIFGLMRTVVERYGYVEYGASILEETALYKAKTGEEIVNEQTYSFIDRGERDVTIRPEMTPTVARMVARKRHELPFPLRWYSIPNLFRYERPQRGRLREHWQLNVDMFGVDNLQADGEIISISYEIMKAFGATDEHFAIKVNNRKLVNFLLYDYLKVSSEQGHALSKIIDRKDKIGEEQFAEQVKTVLPNDDSKLISILNTKDLVELSKIVPDNPGLSELIELIKHLQAKSISNVHFDPSLMRGFDYYTGTIFEVFDTGPANNRSLFGGGRYDDLVGLFEVEKVSGVGFGMGDVTIYDFLETYNLLPEYVPETTLYLCKVSAEFDSYTDALAAELRNQGVNVAVDYSNRKLPVQIKTADKQAIPYLICIGEEEVKTHLYKLKNMKERTETSVSKDQLLELLKRL